MKHAFLPFCILLLAAFPLHAAEFHIDPINGNLANDGSAEPPWRSLQEVIDAGLIESRDWEAHPYTVESRLRPKNPGAPVKAGDTIWLRDGYHGALSIQGYYNSAPITLAAAKGHTPRFHHILLRSGENWILRGLHVSPEFGESDHPRHLLHLNSHNWRGPVRDIVVEDCVLRTAKDTSDWSADDWNRRAASGIQADGTRIVLRGNHVKNIDFGISVAASHALVEHNTVENFAGDGMRGLGDHSVFQYNTVKNCYKVNNNHDDGFQSWSRSEDGIGRGEVVGIVLRGNTFINYEDPDQPHRGALQGIGCFDGTFVDWVVENNLVIVDHYHGITLLGARGCRIVNNTVVNPREGSRRGAPWIRIGKHKRGTPPSDCIVRNNLAPSFQIDAGAGMVEDHNLAVEDPAAIFVDAPNRDFRLRPGSPAIGAGSAEEAPATDIAGIARPQGTGVDVGAYEFAGASRGREDG